MSPTPALPAFDVGTDFTLSFTERNEPSGWDRHWLHIDGPQAMLYYAHYKEQPYQTAAISAEDLETLSELINASGFLYLEDTYGGCCDEDHLDATLHFSSVQTQVRWMDDGAAPEGLYALEAELRAVMARYFDPPERDVYRFLYRVTCGDGGIWTELTLETVELLLTYESDNAESAYVTQLDVDEFTLLLDRLDFWSLGNYANSGCGIDDGQCYDLEMYAGTYSHTSSARDGCPVDPRFFVIAADLNALKQKYI